MKLKTDCKTIDAPLYPAKGNLPKPKWRAALARLLGPAIRMHRYRNLRSALFYDAVCRYDRGKPS